MRHLDGYLAAQLVIVAAIDGAVAAPAQLADNSIAAETLGNRLGVAGWLGRRRRLSARELPSRSFLHLLRNLPGRFRKPLPIFVEAHAFPAAAQLVLLSKKFHQWRRATQLGKAAQVVLDAAGLAALEPILEIDDGQLRQQRRAMPGRLRQVRLDVGHASGLPFILESLQ